MNRKIVRTKFPFQFSHSNSRFVVFKSESERTEYSIQFEVIGKQISYKQEQDLWTVTFKRKVARKDIALTLQCMCDIYFIKGYLTTLEFVTMEFLTSYLLGDKISASQIKDQRERIQIVSSFLILLFGERHFLFETREELIPLEQLFKTSLFPFKINNLRTLKSRLQIYNPASLLKIETVPDDSYNLSEEESYPYISYCKGYSESYQKKTKTPLSFELDGEEFEEERDPLLILLYHQLSQLIVNVFSYKSQEYEGFLSTVEDFLLK